MSNQLLLLTSINNRINQLNLPTKNYYDKAKYLCYCLFTEIINDGCDFTSHKEFPIEFFQKMITNPPTRSLILRELKNAGIIEATKYSSGTAIINGVLTKLDTPAYSRSYKFAHSLIYNSPVHFSQFKNINKKGDRVKFTQINDALQKITVNPDVYDFIPELIEDELNKIEIGTTISNKMITIKIDKKEVKKPLCYWLAVATNKNISLIKFHDKFYLESVINFKERKRIELEISYTNSIENIANGHFYANRNETNNRLDYNLTGLKKELFPYILLDGEITEEIDIKNAQFAILSNIETFKMDSKFVEVAQSGQLYSYIGSKLNMTKEEDVKKYMIVVAFGKVEHHQKELNELFPVTMNSISDFKNEYGYKEFSIMLQNAESNLMIDGVFFDLVENNIMTLPIHDSMRVKKSEAEKAKKMIEDFFIEKELKFTLKNK